MSEITGPNAIDWREVRIRIRIFLLARLRDIQGIRFRMPDFLAEMSLWGRVATIAVSVAAVIGFTYGLLHTHLFAISKIEIEGVSQLSQAEVMSIARVKRGDFLADVRIRKMESRLRSDPRIASVDVSRDWPDGLKIDIKERTALAVAQTSDKRWAVIGDDGRVLSVSAAPPSGLPNAVGVQAPTEPGATLDSSAKDLVLVAGMMPQSLAPRVVQMQIEGGEIRLGLNTGTVVLIGDTSNLSDKLMAAAAVVSKSDPTKISQLDVRSASSPIATPKSAPPPPPSTSTSTTKPPSSNKNSDSSKPSTSQSKPSTTTTTTTVKTR